MKKLFACLAFTFALVGKSADLEFVIIVPSYNNEKYAARNLESLINQNTDSLYSIIVVNDCSKDKTGEILEEVKKKHGLSDSFLKIIHNPKRIGALANIYHTVHDHCKDHQIVIHVDGDDALPHKNIIKRLEKEYADPNLWMTYGQFIFFPCWQPTGRQWGTTYEITHEDQVNKRIRSLVYVAQHLRTFKAGLFKKIQKEDLMLNGAFYEMNADMATMIPMLEMAAPVTPDSKSRSLFIPDIMYIYNCINPINDHTVDRSLQLSLEEVIRALPAYEPLETLD